MGDIGYPTVQLPRHLTHKGTHMKRDEGLFDNHDEPVFGGLSRREDPPTSQNAGYSFNAKNLCVKVLRVIAEAGDHGATSEDTADATGIDLQSISPRFGDFRNPNRFPVAPAMVLVKGGSVVKRPGRSGRARQVWVITTEGKHIVQRAHTQPALSVI